MFARLNIRFEQIEVKNYIAREWKQMFLNKNVSKDFNISKLNTCGRLNIVLRSK